MSSNIYFSNYSHEKILISSNKHKSECYYTVGNSRLGSATYQIS